MMNILLNWYYERQDLTKPLLELGGDVKVFFVFKHSKDDGRKFDFPQNIEVLYWGDFKSPYHLLKYVQPDIVVFYDIEAFNQIALNIAARNRGITTYVLQHGLRGGYEIDDAINNAPLEKKINFSNTSRSTFLFFLRSLRPKNIAFFLSIIKFCISRKRNDLTVALFRNKFELRNADYYIEFSKANCLYHARRDGIPADRFIIIGNPAYDDFFLQLNTSIVPESKYALLIDSPFCEANFVQTIRMSKSEKNDYIQKMNNYCKLMKIRLYIKLHPLTYNADYLIQDENICYFRDHTLVDLVKGARLVFLVHFASLVPIVIHYKPFFFFNNKYVDHNEFMKSLPVNTYDLSNFNPEKLAEDNPNTPLDMKSLQDYLYSADGKSTDRLKEILRGKRSSN